MTAPDDAMAAPAPALAVNNITPKNKLLPPPEVLERALAGDSGPVEVGGVLCQRLALSRCSPLLLAEKVAEALRECPDEVRAAGRDEILALLRARARASDVLLMRIVRKLGLPDEPLQYSHEHARLAHEIALQALADCAVCVIDAVEFFEKFVADVFEGRDGRGRPVYTLVVRAGGEEFSVSVRPGEFRGRGKGQKLKVPPALNDALRAKLGIEIDQRSAGDLLTLIELHAKPDTILEELALKQALRQILRLPLLPERSYHGRWCRGGLLYVPSRLLGEIVDAFALRFRSRQAFTRIAKKLGVLAERHYVYYTPGDFDCGGKNCAAAYVFSVERVAGLLEIAEEEVCR
ncbi:MAG: hypothetical protein LM577_07175 [Thermoproteaceae archaeon]|nr:hypothetical protein [Thermoproteaceae archaeon]